jgi:uncharacterized protein
VTGLRLRPAEKGDHAAILELNDSAIGPVTPLDESSLGWLTANSYRAVVVEAGDPGSGERPESDALAAFAISFAPGSAYQSANYRWFAERYAEFLYVDRIVVAGPWRRRGIATYVYDAFELDALAFGRLVCEVNLEPPNLESLEFHRRRGFLEVGRREDAGQKVLSMLAKELVTAGERPGGAPAP